MTHEKWMATLTVSVVLLTSLLALGIAGIPQAAAVSSPATQPSKVLTVIVSRAGFNGTAGQFNITVNQGDQVKITFVYGDSNLPYDNPHAIMIDGYGIKTITIDKSNPTATVEFVANTSGKFRFYCYVPCVGMENLMGSLVVGQAQGTRLSTTTSLAISYSHPNFSFLIITATVKDASGTPLAGMPVKFYENTTFGELLLDTKTSNPQGLAVLNYTVSRAGVVQIIAEDQGSGQYANSSSSVLVTIPPHLMEKPGQGTIYLGVHQPRQPSGLYYGINFPANFAMIAVPRITNIATVTIAGVIILSVWSTYGYVFRQLSKMPKYGKSKQEEATLTPPPVLPVYTGSEPSTEHSAAASKTMILLVSLTPLVGVLNVFVVNQMALPIIWQAATVVGLALIETIAALTALRN